MPVTHPHLYMLTHQLTNAYLAAAMPTIKRCTSECSGRGDKETATREATCRIVCHAHGLAHAPCLGTYGPWPQRRPLASGVCGGVAMPMSRTIMQQTAPPALRARVMSFYAFSFMGAGPLGALWAGYMADLFGPQMAIVISSAGMASLVLVMAFISPLWGSATEQSPHS